MLIQTFRRLCRAVRLCATVLIVVLVLLGPLAGRSAIAQGTSGLLPDPISSRDLTEYGRRIGLSDQQLIAAETVHDQYKREFARLRDGEIKELMDTLQKMQAQTRGGMPSREIFEDILRTIRKLNDRIAAVDRSFFDQLQPLLTEEQMPYLQRARQARARARVGSQEMMMVSGGQTMVDVSRLVLDLDLAPATRRLVNDQLASYETNVTAATRRLSEAALTMWVDIFDALEARGFNADSMAEPEEQMRMATMMQEIFAEVSANAMKHATEIRELNRAAVKSVGSHMDPTSRRALRRDFLAKAYPELQQITANHQMPAWDTIDVDRFSPEDLETLESIRLQVDGHTERFHDRGMDVVDAYRASTSPMNFDTDAMQAYQQKLADLRPEYQESMSTCQQQLLALLGPDGLEEADRSPHSHDIPSPPVAPAEIAEDLQTIGRYGQYMPHAITTSQLNRLLKPLELTEADQAIVAELHRNYKERYAAIKTTFIDPLQAIQRRMWGFNDATMQQDAPDPDAADDLLKNRRDGIKAILDADNLLFEEIGLAVGSTARTHAIERARRVRQRDIFELDPHANMVLATAGPYVEVPADMTTMFGPTELAILKTADADSETPDTIMLNYEQQLTNAMRHRFDRSLEYQHAMDKWSVASHAQSMQEDGDSISLSMRYMETITGPHRALVSAHDAINTINQEALEKFCALATPDQAMTFRDTYKRNAFPNVFEASRDLGGLFDRALELDDLTARQREDLEALALEYRPAARDFSDRIIELVRSRPSAPSFGMGEDFDWRAYQEFQNQLSATDFERDDLNHRTVRRLRVLLNDKQIARIGGMPNLERDDNGRF